MPIGFGQTSIRQMIHTMTPAIDSICSYCCSAGYGLPLTENYPILDVGVNQKGHMIS
jgi:hypothetical protein